MGRQAAGAAEDLRMFHHGIEGDQSTHARAHDHSVVARRAGAVSAVDEGLQLFHQKSEIAVGQWVAAVEGQQIRPDVPRQGADHVGRHVFAQAQRGVVNADHDRHPDLAPGTQPADMFIHAPFDSIAGPRIVEQVLAVVHVEDRPIHGVFLITGREPDGDVARPYMGRGHLRVFDKSAGGRNLGPRRQGPAEDRQGGQSRQGMTPVDVHVTTFGSVTRRLQAAAMKKLTPPSTRAQMAWLSNRFFRIRPRMVAASSWGTTMKMLKMPM